MYKLETKRNNLLDKTEKPKTQNPKKNRTANLREDQWQFIEELAQHSGMSRNKALRELLDHFMQGAEH